MNVLNDVNINYSEFKLFDNEIRKTIKKIEYADIKTINESYFQLLAEIEEIGVSIQKNIINLTLLTFTGDINFDRAYGAIHGLINGFKELNLVCLIKHMDIKKHQNYDQLRQIIRLLKKAIIKRHRDVTTK